MIKIDAEAYTSFGESYTKANLEEGLVVFVRRFYLKNREFCLSQGISEKIIDLFYLPRKPPTYKKEELVSYCFPVFTSEVLFKAFRDSLPKGVQSLLYELLWQNHFTEIAAEKITGEPLFTEEKGKSNWDSNRKILKKDYYFFVVKTAESFSSSFQKPWFQLSLPAEFKKLLQNYYPKPPEWDLTPVAPQPTEFVFEGEASVFQDMPRVIAYYLQDQLKFSQRGKPNVASVNKLRKSLDIKEFYPEHEELGKMRSYLLASFISEADVKKISDDSLETLHRLFHKHFLRKTANFTELLLSQLKGFANAYYPVAMESVLWDLLKMLPAHEWIEVNSLEKFIKLRNIPFQPISDYDARNRIYYEYETLSQYTNTRYKEKNYVMSHYQTLVVQGLLKGAFFLFAAAGLADIAYNTPDTTTFGSTYFSEYDGLRYVKLNALGAYITGLLPGYEKQPNTQNSQLIFSEDSLIILADGDLSINEVLLKNFTEKVSGNRFRVTAQVFLKDCKNKKELKNKISLFRQTVSAELPSNWLAFLEELSQKSNAFSKTEDVVIYKLLAHDRELQRLIAQDSELKKVVIKAEDFHVLVKKDLFSKFKNRLKEFGYLVE